MRVCGRPCNKWRITRLVTCTYPRGYRFPYHSSGLASTYLTALLPPTIEASLWHPIGVSWIRNVRRGRTRVSCEVERRFLFERKPTAADVRTDRAVIVPPLRQAITRNRVSTTVHCEARGVRHNNNRLLQCTLFASQAGRWKIVEDRPREKRRIDATSDRT